MFNDLNDEERTRITRKMLTARALMFVPTLIMLIVASIFFYQSNYKSYSYGDHGMWERFSDELIIMPIFLVSLLIIIPCLIAGLVKIEKARKHLASLSSNRTTLADPYSTPK